MATDSRGTGLRRKKNFGGASVNHFTPSISDRTPVVLNCVLSFEEGLKLHLSLGQALAHLNGYDRSTTGGRRTAAQLCVHTRAKRIFVVQGKTRQDEA